MDDDALVDRVVNEALERQKRESRPLCPLRRLAKWAESVNPWQRSFDVVYNNEWLIECSDDNRRDGDSRWTTGRGSTILEAAADAVRQLKEKGEL